MTSDLPKTPGPPPPVYLLVALLCEWALHNWLPLHQVLEWPWRWAGLFFVFKGVALAGMGRIQFLRHKTSVRPFTRSDALVTAIPFEWTRNPMYTGMLLVLAGEALLFGSVGPWLVVPIMWLVLDRLFVRVEEVCMQLQFGPAYEAYCARVRRWV